MISFCTTTANKCGTQNTVDRNTFYLLFLFFSFIIPQTYLKPCSFLQLFHIMHEVELKVLMDDPKNGKI